MDVRPPETPAEYRDALLVIERAWKDAFEGIIDDETLSELSFTAGEQSMAERFENAMADSDRLDLVAIEDSEKRSSSGWEERSSSGNRPTAGDSRTDSDEGEVVGTGTLVWGETMKPFADGSAVELRTLYVDPTRQGEGIGTMILDCLLSDLPHDADRLVLETLTENEIGISFYRSQGFETVGEHEFTVEGTTYPTVVFERLIDG